MKKSTENRVKHKENVAICKNGGINWMKSRFWLLGNEAEYQILFFFHFRISVYFEHPRAFQCRHSRDAKFNKNTHFQIFFEFFYFLFFTRHVEFCTLRNFRNYKLDYCTLPVMFVHCPILRYVSISIFFIKYLEF